MRNKRKAVEKQENQKREESSNSTAENRPSVLLLPFIKGITNKIGRILRRQNICTTYESCETISSFPPKPKDKIPPEKLTLDFRCSP